MNKQNQWRTAAWKSLDEFEIQTANLYNTESPMFQKYEAIENGVDAELFVHEVQNMARARLTKWETSPEGIAFAERMKSEAVEYSHDRACELVSIWAKATGKTGTKHKQSRQSHIRKLVKNGMSSEYARRMMAQAGMVTE